MPWLKAQIITNWFLEHDNKLTVLKWPPSPDLNPVEYLWDVVEQDICIMEVQPTHLQQLHDTIMSICTNISEEYFLWELRQLLKQKVVQPASSWGLYYCLPFKQSIDAQQINSKSFFTCILLPSGLIPPVSEDKLPYKQQSLCELLALQYTVPQHTYCHSYLGFNWGSTFRVSCDCPSILQQHLTPTQCESEKVKSKEEGTFLLIYLIIFKVNKYQQI